MSIGLSFMMRSYLLVHLVEAWILRRIYRHECPWKHLDTYPDKYLIDLH